MASFVYCHELLIISGAKSTGNSSRVVIVNCDKLAAAVVSFFSSLSFTSYTTTTTTPLPWCSSGAAFYHNPCQRRACLQLCHPYCHIPDIVCKIVCCVGEKYFSSSNCHFYFFHALKQKVCARHLFVARLWCSWHNRIVLFCAQIWMKMPWAPIDHV